LSTLLTGVIGSSISVAVALASGIPEPRIHDEFSYLLAGDTFANGRLTNPAHPCWIFFETFHVNVLPTYCSIYPPGQGLFLALGQFVFGLPIAGVWISFGLACAATCWMLQAYMPPRWALLGAMLAEIRVGFLGSWAAQPGYWSQSYWGGVVAMLGGALALGAVPRLMKRHRAWDSMLLGLGLSILAVSRPYEGLALSVPILAVGAVWGFCNPRTIARCALPACVVVGAALTVFAYYNDRVSGDPFRLAYQLSAKTYAVVPTFVWQSLNATPEYRHEVIRDYQTRWAGDRYRAKHSIQGYARDLQTRIADFIGFYLGITLVIPFATLPSILKHSGPRLLAASCGAVLIALCLTTWFQPHYAAPITAPLFALVALGMRHVRTWHWREHAVGLLFVRAVPITYLALLVVAIAEARDLPTNSWHQQRARLVRDLENGGGSHLIFVRYGPKHDCTDEWVFNRADIDGSKIVWARDMGQPANRQIREYFSDRQAWLLEVDAETIRMGPYPSDP
jgi:hypothetical protein